MAKPLTSRYAEQGVVRARRRRANWLAAPLGGLDAYLRLSVPEPSALDRSWTPPPIRTRWAVFG